MRIGLNLLPVVPGVGGSWHYISGLIAALAEQDRTNEYVAFVTQASAPFIPARSSFRIIEMPLYAQWRSLRVAFENTVLPTFIGRAKLDCMHHFFGALPFFAHLPSVVTVHDLMVFERPRDFRPIKRFYLQYMERRTALRASVVAPVSRTTGEHLHRLLGVPWDRMQVVPAAVSTAFAPADASRVAQFRVRHGLPDEFWLCVSATYPHKNYERLLAALGALRRQNPTGWPLAIRADPIDALREPIARHGVEKHVVILPRLPDGEMPLLYSAAAALVFPSLFEGGGIPVMEAMACGCPVVASDIPTTREFAGEAAMRFDPTDVDALAAAMLRCEQSPAERGAMRAAGLVAAKRFSPGVVAPACLDAYTRAVSSSSG